MLCFSLAAYKILSLSLTFGILIMMCFGVVLFGSNLFGTLCFLDLYLYFLHQIREVFFHYFFPISFQFLALSLLLLAFYDSDVAMFGDVPEKPYTIPVFFSSFFFLLFWLKAYFSLTFQIIDLNPGFIPSTIGSL